LTPAAEKSMPSFQVGPRSNLVFSPEGETLIALSPGGAASSWSIGGEGRLERKLADGMPKDLAVSETGRLATAGDFGWMVQDDTFAGKPRVVFKKSAPSKPGSFLLTSVSLSGDQHRIAIGTLMGSAPKIANKVPNKDPQIEIIAPDTGATVFSLPFSPNSRGTGSVALDPHAPYVGSGILLESSSEPQSLPVAWRIGNDTPVLEITAANSSTPEQKRADLDIAGVAFSPDGRFFAAARFNGAVEFYRLRRQGDAIEFGSAQSLHPGTGAAYFPAFSPDGTRLAVSTRSGVFLFDQTGVLLGAPLDPGFTVYRLAFSSNGRFLSGAGPDGTIRTWDVQAPQPAVVIPLAVSPPGPDWFVGVGFSPDDRLLVAGDPVLGATVTFDLDPKMWVAEACAIAGRELSPDERSTYLHNAAAPLTCSSR
jgi:WD40 repeat protein